MKARYVSALVTAALFILSGCVQDISHTLETEPSAVEVIATPAETTVTTVTTTTKKTTTTTTTSEITTGSESQSSDDDTTVTPTEGTYTIYSDEYKDFVLTDEYKDFLSKCVFVGDSICSGLKAYEIIPSDRVVAVGNIAARNIFEDWVEFKIHGEKMTLISALVDLKPEYVVFSMGMNDVNMTSEQTFCKNYEKILWEVESFLPDTKLIVLSVTPVTYGENGKLFTTNQNIDSFNAALKEYLDGTKKWIYADVAHEMKNTSNMLKDDYLGSPDGVHLAPAAYYAILYQLCERVVDGKVYNFDGTFTSTEGLSTPETADAMEATVTTKKTKKTTTEKPPEEDEPVLSGSLNISDPD